MRNTTDSNCIKQCNIDQVTLLTKLKNTKCYFTGQALHATSGHQWNCLEVNRGVAMARRHSDCSSRGRGVDLGSNL